MKKIFKVLSMLALSTGATFGICINTQAMEEIPIYTKGYVYDHDHCILKEGVFYNDYKNTPRYVPGFKKCEEINTYIIEKKNFYTKLCNGKQTNFNELEYKASAVYDLGDVCLPYQSEVVGYFPAGSSGDFTVSKTKSTTVQEMLSKTLSSEFVTSMSASAKGDILKLGVNTSSKITSAIETTYSFSETYSVSETDTYHIPIKEDGYYLKQLRAIFNAYLVVEYERDYNYEVMSRHVHWFHEDINYYLSPKPWKLTNISLAYAMKTNLGRDFVKYELNSDGSLVYAGPKTSDDIIYF